LGYQGEKGEWQFWGREESVKRLRWDQRAGYCLKTLKADGRVQVDETGDRKPLQALFRVRLPENGAEAAW
jgi:hypothetical protein